MSDCLVSVKLKTISLLCLWCVVGVFILFSFSSGLLNKNRFKIFKTIFSTIDKTVKMSASLLHRLNIALQRFEHAFPMLFGGKFPPGNFISTTISKQYTLTYKFCHRFIRIGRRSCSTGLILANNFCHRLLEGADRRRHLVGSSSKSAHNREAMEAQIRNARVCKQVALA